MCIRDSRYEERPPRREGGYREERPPRQYEERLPRDAGRPQAEESPARGAERPPIEPAAVTEQPVTEPPRPAKVAPGARRGRGRFGRRPGGQAHFRARRRLPEHET
ncbi:MAG: hypothetical protein N2378_00325, partial [Chloroflexaceae bacterium]|nr:hypothetical protein [Chloroflexaceae bacterium]